MTPEEWADAALVELREDLVAFKFPLSLEQAASFMRAAYGRGYCHALAEAEPPITLAAFNRALELELRIPVS